MRFQSAAQALLIVATCFATSACKDGLGAEENRTRPAEGIAAAADPITAPVSAVTATETQTVTATETATVTETTTAVSTVTLSSTSTVTNTVSSITTVTQTLTQTVTETATETKTEPEIAEGTYTGETCFLNALASESIGQKIYTRSAIRFGRHGIGANHFALFEDSDCTRPLMEGRVRIRYSVTKYFDRLLLIAVDQYNDPKDKKSLVRYWIPALATKEGLLLDINAEKGGRGPLLNEPTDEELKSMLDGMEDRAVPFQKG